MYTYIIIYNFIVLDIVFPGSDSDFLPVPLIVTMMTKIEIIFG